MGTVMMPRTCGPKSRPRAAREGVGQWAPRFAWEPHHDPGGSKIRVKYLKLKVPWHPKVYRVVFNTRID
jgi:hypothetical protein